MLQLVLRGIRNPEHTGQEVIPGASLPAMAKGTRAGQTQKQVDLSCSTLAPVQRPQIPLEPSGVRRWPTRWRWVVSSCASLLETSQPCVLQSSFMDPLERKRLGVWDSVFSVTKAVMLGAFSTAEHFICTLTAFVRPCESKKPRSKHGDVNIITWGDFTFLRSKFLFWGRKKGRRGFEHPHLVGIDPSKSI